MDLHGLSTGWPGVWQVAAIACGLGLLLSVLAHLLAPRLGWREGSAIGVALLLALVLGAGVDGWQLFHLSIVRLESPYVIQRTLAAIHDPGMLGVRVLFEFLGAITGVMAGWFFSGASPRR